MFDRLLMSIRPPTAPFAMPMPNACWPRRGRAHEKWLGPSTSPADLMLRIMNAAMVDSYLELHQRADPATWTAGRKNCCDKARALPRLALDDGHPPVTAHAGRESAKTSAPPFRLDLEAVETWAPAETEPLRHERRAAAGTRQSRDVLEHIERVIHHVDRLERSAETAVQMHFSVQGGRTNDTMETLAALTAIFLPLDLIIGFFGMNSNFCH